MAHFLPPEHVRQVNKLEWPYRVLHEPIFLKAFNALLLLAYLANI